MASVSSGNAGVKSGKVSGVHANHVGVQGKLNLTAHSLVTKTSTHSASLAPKAVGHESLKVVGASSHTSAKVIDHQTASKAGTTLHMPDGTSMTIVGASHIGHGFFH